MNVSAGRVRHETTKRMAHGPRAAPARKPRARRRKNVVGFMAATLEPGSAITAELEQFYADAEATQDFADDALLDWLDGALTGFDADQPHGPPQEVRGPKSMYARALFVSSDDTVCKVAPLVRPPLPAPLARARCRHFRAGLTTSAAAVWTTPPRTSATAGDCIPHSPLAFSSCVSGTADVPRTRPNMMMLLLVRAACTAAAAAAMMGGLHLHRSRCQPQCGRKSRTACRPESCPGSAGCCRRRASASRRLLRRGAAPSPGRWISSCSRCRRSLLSHLCSGRTPLQGSITGRRPTKAGSNRLQMPGTAAQMATRSSSTSIGSTRFQMTVRRLPGTGQCAASQLERSSRQPATTGAGTG